MIEGALNPGGLWRVGRRVYVKVGLIVIYGEGMVDQRLGQEMWRGNTALEQRRTVELGDPACHEAGLSASLAWVFNEEAGPSHPRGEVESQPCGSAGYRGEWVVVGERVQRGKRLAEDTGLLGTGPARPLATTVKGEFVPWKCSTSDCTVVV